eukprot:169897-Hanusia_phi.AAC.3
MGEGAKEGRGREEEREEKERKSDRDRKKDRDDRDRKSSRRSRSRSRSRDRRRRSKSPDRKKDRDRRSRSRSRDRRKRSRSPDRHKKKDKDRRRSRSRSRSRSRDKDEKKKKRDEEKEREREKEREKEKEKATLISNKAEAEKENSVDQERQKEIEKEKELEEEKRKEAELEQKRKEQEELEEQMRIRRERVAKWREEQNKATGNSEEAAGAESQDTEMVEQAEIVEEETNQQKQQMAEENYFDKDDDDDDEEMKPAAPEEAAPIEPQANDGGAQEEEEDPLEAYMKSVNSEVKQLEEVDKKRMSNVVDMDSILKMNKNQGSGNAGKPRSMEGLGVRMEVEDSIPDLDDELKRKNEEFDIKQWLESKNQCRNLRPVDHSQMHYTHFRRNFYIEVPEIAKMTDDEVKDYRSTLDGIKVRGKRCPNPIKTWFQCGLSDRVLAVIKKLNWKKPTPIQCQALPVIMSGRDCIAVAKTGSGKTAGYLLPCFRHVLDQPPIEIGEGPVALVFTPARELCIQVFLQAKHFFKHTGVTGCAVYGGAPVADQIAELKKGPQIVICTPGRMIDMLCANAGRVTNLRRVTYLTIDEADRMFDLGFEPQITKVLENTRPDRQTVFFSATFPKQMESLARKHLRNPIEMVVGGRSVVSDTIEHYVELREASTRFLRTLELLGEWYEKGQILLFVERQESCDELMGMLIKQGYAALTLHGGMDQADRDSTLADYKNQVANILIATSLAARGLDVPGLNLVVSYDPPSHYEDYVHRVGRTGRAGRKGTAYTFVDPSQRQLIPDLVRALTLSNRPVPKDLREIVNEIKAEKKKGNKMAKGSGFGGKGYKFDETEQAKMKEAAAKQRKQLLLQNGEEVSDDDEENIQDEDFEEQASNLTVQYQQKVADWSAKTIEKESNKAFNDLVKKATGGLLLKDIVPTNAAGVPTAGAIGNPVLDHTIPLLSSPQLALRTSSPLLRRHKPDRQASNELAGALVTSDIAARAKAAAAALGLTPSSGGAAAPMAGGGALVATGGQPPSAIQAMEAAKRAAAALGLGGDGTENDHYSEELEINDYPQASLARETRAPD